MDKKWQIIKSSRSEGGRLDTTYVVNTLLRNRGISDSDLFFKPPRLKEVLDRLGAFFPDLDIHQLNKASKRVEKALSAGEKMAVWGDYDVDGICATAILWQALYDLKADVIPHIPDRFSEGYGLSTKSIRKLKEEGIHLIITVDSGITAKEEVEFANDLGIDVIVTDHHIKPKSLPKAHSIVHTTNLCGAGVAWLLAAHIAGSMRKLTRALDLVAIATVADLQPLTGANRSLVKKGFEVLKRLERPGLAALAEVARLKKGSLDSYAAGWILGPRINAVGRMAHAIDALRLLCTGNLTRARELAHLLDSVNTERKALTADTLDHARELVDGEDGLIVVYHDDWHEGIIGLVAGRLVEEYGRPSVVIAKGSEFSKGSARSVNGLDIVRTLRKNEELLEDVGGHEAAAGFTVRNENLEQLVSSLKRGTKESILKLDPRPLLKIDMELPLDSLTYELIYALEDFKPYGVDNPEPLFVARNVTVLSSRFVGRNKTHLKLNLAPGFEAIWFSAAEKLKEKGLPDGFSRGDEVSIAFSPSIEKWQGKEKVALRVIDLRAR